MKKHNFQDIAPRRHQHSSLAIHPYFGKVDPAIVEEAIASFSKKGDVVLDPFCGSGTVLHDAVTSGRSVLGFDSSPLACLIATAKTLGISLEEEHELLDVAAQICQPQDLFNIRGRKSLAVDWIPNMPRVRSVNDWFGPNAIKELAFISTGLKHLESTLSVEALVLAQIAFSRIVTPASKQKGESTYSRTEKDDSPNRVLDLFGKSIRHVIRSAKAFNFELEKAGLPVPRTGRMTLSKQTRTTNHGGVFVSTTNFDARQLQTDHVRNSLAKMVVTSPPYLMSWDYGLYHKFRFYWLGFDLDGYEESEIGRHLRRQDDDVVRYEADMKSVFSSLRKVTAKNAHAIFVNSPSVVYGELVDTNKLLQVCAIENGWQCLGASDTIGIPGPHHGMYASLDARKAVAPGQAGKKEHVLIFQKTND